MAKEVWTEKESITDSKAVHASQMLFPIGELNDGFAQYFTIQSYLAPVSGSQVGIFNLTFEQGCRNNWHIHCCQGQRHHTIYAEVNATCVLITSIGEMKDRIYYI